MSGLNCKPTWTLGLFFLANLLLLAGLTFVVGCERQPQSVEEIAGSSFSLVVQGATFSEFTIPTPGNPAGLTDGPDGALWFTEQSGNKIGRITTAGVISEFTIPTPGSVPLLVVAGPDGALWFTEQGSNAIGRISTAGVITEFPIPTAGVYPNGITAGADGSLWFTEQFGNQIGRITTAGVITEFPIPTAASRPLGIVSGPDGALWFAEFAGNQIGRITTAGVVTEFSIPTISSGPAGMTAGPDGALWFTESGPLDGAAVPHGSTVGRITTTGVITEFTTPTATSGVSGITAGPDGTLWFTEYVANQIGRISTTGVITEFSVPTASSGPGSITAGPDGAIWFNENGANQIARLILPYNFSGFVAPVDNPPIVNVAKAGSAIPVKFSLHGNQGLNILVTGSPSSRTILCDNGASQDDIELTVTAGGSSLSYDPVADLYTYVWKTDKTWAGACRELTVTLNDNSIHKADFKFTK